MAELYVGVDTSNYTTSVAAVDLEGNIVANIKIPLPVKPGELGLRQQAALFEHTKNLPDAFLRLEKVIDSHRIAAVGVSQKPRNAEGSYMPCFLAGVSAAQAFAVAANVPLYKFSHQCGHIRAAVAGSGAEVNDEEFTAIHISGGTTEMLLCRRSREGYDCKITGGTLDLCAGQAVDRTGVMLGYPFPCGKYLEEAALEYKGDRPKFKLSVKGTYFNLSGLENLVKKEFATSGDKGRTSVLALDFIAASLYSAISAQLDEYGDMQVICSGGVMSNSLIKNVLSDIPGIRFAPPALSADNAVGIAYLARDSHISATEEKL